MVMVVVCVGGACMHVCMWCMAVACDGSGCVHMHGGDGPYEF